MSKYQTVEQVREALAEPSNEFVIINATTGLRGVSPALDANTAEARASSDLTGFYCWSQTVNDLATTPDKVDPIGEARNFLSRAPLRAGDLVALDHEEALGTWPQRLDYAVRWIQFVADQTGATPLLYINGDWLSHLYWTASVEQRTWLFRNLWYSRPTGTPGDYGTNELYKPETYAGARVLVHQFSTANNLDRNWTSDFEALKACGVK